MKNFILVTASIYSGFLLGVGSSQQTPTKKEKTSLQKLAKKNIAIQLSDQVRFVEGTKTHDGLSPETQLFDEVVHDLFNRPENRYRTIRIMLNTFELKNLKELKDLSEKMIDLQERCLESNTPVLKRGGGRNNIVGKDFAPWLLKMSTKIQEYISLIKDHLIAEEEIPEKLGDSFKL